MKQLATAIFTLIWPGLLHISLPSEFVVWNVGQGQWITIHKPNTCFHFDMGGESLPMELAARVCRKKANVVYFSHWDRDHVQFFSAATRVFPLLCVAQKPRGHAASFMSGFKIAAWPKCDQDFSAIQILSDQPETGASKRPRRNSSFVYIYDGKWLLPGDSPAPEEKQWVHKIIKPDEIHGMILGHHGSSTSTGQPLLNQLTHLQIAIASARSARYGHPDSKLISRLRMFGMIPLRTEDFGHLRFRN